VPPVLAVLPLKSFSAAKERLDLVAGRRAAVAAAAAGIVATACHTAGLDVAVVTGDREVSSWASERGAFVVDDPGTGLDDAAAAGVSAAGSDRPGWLVVHGDLPLLGAADVEVASRAIAAGITVLAPSRDGGTNLLGSPRPLRFRYGPGSFARHLAAAAAEPQLILVRTGTAIEIDTIADLRGAARLPGGEWLSDYLS
jgi:2-phospho-L-lactate guanylyltransferase